MPFIGFKNLVHLTKSCESGLLLNILTDLSIIYRLILISYDRGHAYLQSQSRRIAVYTHVCMCVPAFRSEDAPSVSNCPLFSSTSVRRRPSARSQEEDKINQRNAENN